jgi:poly(3-hydroxybutyrate) depolymerase
VFHGDSDRTVAASNADCIVDQALSGLTLVGAMPLKRTHSERMPAGAGMYTSTVYATRGGRPHIEHWIVHGASHAWSGGSPLGSYTGANGPDASAAMLRFFFAQSRKKAGRWQSRSDAL